MQITVWGARGSLPVSGREYLTYGGDTTCLELRGSEGELIVIDAGSGIRRLGCKLVQEKGRNIHLLFTHGHWDHILGFPFFKPVYRPDFTIDIYGPRQVNQSIRDILANSMHQPNFPVEFKSLAAKITYRDSDEIFAIGGIRITTIGLSHPNGGVGFRFTENGKSFVFLTDNELGFRHPGGETVETYREFCSGADLLMHDAEYRPEEYERFSKGWGHSTYTDALDLAIAAGVRKFGLFHHNTERTDADQEAIVAVCHRIAAERGTHLDCFTVKQDLLIDL